MIKFWGNETLFPHLDSYTRNEGLQLLHNYDPFILMSNIPAKEDLVAENDNSAGNLSLGDTHLRNVFHGKKFTLNRAKEWWRRRHDPRHVLLWNSNTFKLEDPYYNIRPVVENVCKL